MPISKKLRFEVFKRDGFQCAYCGKCPPEIMLEIDHVEPKSQGGTDDINNLITACFDCNRGKTAIPLDRAPQGLVENLEVLKEKEAQLKEYRKFIKRIEERIWRDLHDFDVILGTYFKDRCFADHFKQTKLKKFLTLLPKHKLEEALHIACNKVSNDIEGAIRYFCGICWNWINPERRIGQMWKRLSAYYGKGGGYYNPSDIKLIRHLDLDFIQKTMVMALTGGKRGSLSYWNHFMDLILKTHNG
ncbi:MAG: hypothetical protein DDT19_00059 [Syntrophomonadaceae bacterium]|nr:hypothetical protein [Bacillota bacterium]